LRGFFLQFLFGLLLRRFVLDAGPVFDCDSLQWQNVFATLIDHCVFGLIGCDCDSAFVGEAGWSTDAPEVNWCGRLRPNCWIFHSDEVSIPYFRFVVVVVRLGSLIFRWVL